MARRDLAAILDTYVGNGRPVPVDGKPHEFCLANEAHASGRTVYRWKDDEDACEPDRLQLAAMFESERLPVEMQKEVADTMFRRSRRLRVVLADDAGAGRGGERPLLRITNNLDATLCQLEDALQTAIEQSSPAGVLISAGEAQRIDQHVARIEALVQEVKQGINRRRSKSAG